MKILPFFLLLCAAPLAASQSIAMKSYLALKQDSDLFVGEGTAELKDFDSKAKALDAARSRAKASLAESVKVRISSETSESLKNEDGKVSEKILSESKSKTDLELENVKYMEMPDFPEKGQMTVVASLSKEDYRRQLAGKKVSVFLPEHAFKVKTTLDGPDWLVGHYQPGLNLGLEYMLGCVVFGAMFEVDRVDAANKIGPRQPALGRSSNNSDGVADMNRFEADLGYNWTPWATRYQVFFPFRLQYQRAICGSLAADLFGANAGLAFRFWPTDGFAFELNGRYGAGFNTVELQPYAKGYDPLQGNLGGLQIDIGLLWSGF